MKVFFKLTLGPSSPGRPGVDFLTTSVLFLASYVPLQCAIQLVSEAWLRRAHHDPHSGHLAFYTGLVGGAFGGAIGLNPNIWQRARGVLADSDRWLTRLARTRLTLIVLSGLTIAGGIAFEAVLGAQPIGWGISAPLTAISPALLSARFVYRYRSMEPLDDEMNRDIRHRAFLIGFWILALGMAIVFWTTNDHRELAHPALVAALWLGAAGTAASHIGLERRADRG